MAKHNEEYFFGLLEEAGIPIPVTEYEFSSRKNKEGMYKRWRFDYAWPEYGLALEVQGGNFAGGRHSRGGALKQEYQKVNSAAAEGWRIMFTIPEWIDTRKTPRGRNNQMTGIIKDLREALHGGWEMGNCDCFGCGP